MCSAINQSELNESQVKEITEWVNQIYQSGKVGKFGATSQADRTPLFVAFVCFFNMQCVLSFAGVRTSQYPAKYYYVDKATYCEVKCHRGKDVCEVKMSAGHLCQWRSARSSGDACADARH